MNDHHLDPPDEGPDPPHCPEGCGGFGEVLAHSGGAVPTPPILVGFRCDECGHEWTLEMPQEPDPAWEVNTLEHEDIEPLPEKGLCPHGKTWGECGACDYASDIAYDTERERRMR